MSTRTRTAATSLLGLLAGLLTVLTSSTAAQAAVTVYPVPTSNAGLGRIVTAPDGAMWFLMSDANKVGRITSAGQIQEFALPAPSTSTDGPAQDLDVSPDGTVWVTTDHGSRLTRLSSAGTVVADWTFPNYGGCVGSCPYGGDVRVDPSGVAWVTMNYDESFIVKVSPDGSLMRPANAPACDDVLGEAADGSMWCQGGEAMGQDTIVRVNADAAGGATYPLPQDATYPMGIAAGPVGSIWFTRSSRGSFITNPDDGSIGYLDAGSGGTKTWSTGSRSAPQDLVQAPDGTMWFTNRGAAPAIGHISATGVGAIAAVGNYQPTSLTVGSDGAIWFTDATSNAIVRVTTDQLQTTNVSLGQGVTMIAPGGASGPGGPGGPTGPGGQIRQVGALPKQGTKVVAVRRSRVPVVVSCPRTATAGCAGWLAVEVAKGGKPVTKPRDYAVATGKTQKIKVKMTKKGAMRLRRGKVVVLRAELTAVGAKKPGATRTFKARRR